MQLVCWDSLIRAETSLSPAEQWIHTSIFLRCLFIGKSKTDPFSNPYPYAKNILGIGDADAPNDRMLILECVYFIGKVVLLFM